MENPTSDEKVMAALAHASVLFSFFGPIGATLIWVSHRDKSKYVRFHALQAMGYQAFTFWAWLIGIFVVVFGGIIVISIVEAILMSSTSREMPLVPFIIQPIVFLGIFGLWGLFFMIGIIGAIFCMMNRDFTYPIIGHWLRKKLFASENTDEDFDKWEEHWVSGVGHSTVIMRFFGIVTPIIIWYTQKERSARIRFQALQAIFYQLIAIIISIAGFIFGTALYFLLIAAIVFGAAFAEPSPGVEPEFSPIFGVMFLIFIGVFMLVWLASVILVPLYYLLGAFASLRNISGHDFNYPILGKIISRRLAQKRYFGGACLMNTSENIALSSDEKMMGAIAHLFGPLGAIVVWAIQKDKSRFVKFQALQALAFDVIIALIMGLLFFCIFGAAFLGMSGTMFAAMNDPFSSEEFLPFFFLPFMFPFMIFGCIFPFSFVLLVIRLVAAISILNGRNYQYPVIGKWLNNFLDE